MPLNTWGWKIFRGPIAGWVFLASGLAGYEAEYNQAIEHYTGKRYDEAARLLQGVVEENPDLAEAYRMLGHCHAQLGRTDRARAAFIAALAHGRVSADMLGRLAEIERDADRHVAAVNLLRQAAPLGGADNKEIGVVLAQALVRIGATAEAEAIYLELRNAAPADSRVALRLGNLYRHQDRHADALTMLLTAYYLGNETPALPSLIAELYAAMADPEEAVAWYAVVIDTDKTENVRAALRRAHLYVESDDFDQAERLLQSIGDSDDSDARGDAHALLARLELNRGNIDRAANYWRQAVDAGFQDDHMSRALGTLFFNEGDYAAAASCLASIPAGSADPRLLYAAMTSLMETGRKTEVWPRLRSYVAAYGMDEYAAEVVDRLTE